jgi:hypothetical protein
VDGCPLFNDCAAFVEVSPTGVGEAGGAAAGCVVTCVADCAGAGFCAEDGAADEEFGGAVVLGAASGCAAGGWPVGVGAEPDCGAGAAAGFGCLTSEGGGSSVVAGGVALFCGGVDWPWHGGANHVVAQAKPTDNAKAQAKRSTRQFAAQPGARLPATVLIRPLLPAASVRNPRVPSVTTQSLLHGSLLARSVPVNRGILSTETGTPRRQFPLANSVGGALKSRGTTNRNGRQNRYESRPEFGAGDRT